MAFSGFDAQLVGELRRTGATGNQTYLIQRVLRGISRASLFSQHVSSTGGMSADLPRVQAVLTSFASSGQPSRGLLRGLCDGTAATLERVIDRWGRHAVLVDLRQVLRDTALSIADPAKPLDQQKRLTSATIMPAVAAMKTQRSTEPISRPVAAKVFARFSMVTCAAMSAGRPPMMIAERHCGQPGQML